MTRCKQRALCVDALPPVEDLRTVYQELRLQLVIQTGDTIEKMVGLQDLSYLPPFPFSTTCLWPLTPGFFPPSPGAAISWYEGAQEPDAWSAVLLLHVLPGQSGLRLQPRCLQQH